MSKSGRRISGFFKAMLLAVLGFFVIFLFFPDLSESLFGVSLRGTPELTEKVTEKVGEVAGSAVDAATDVVKDVVQSTTNAVSDVVSDTVSSVVDNIKSGGN